jgi:hypothetical protein
VADDDGDELWAWQVQETDGSWSMVGMILPDMSEGKAGQVGQHTPMIHRKKALVDQVMRPYAEHHARATGQPLRLAHFTLTSADGVVV